MDPSEKSLRSFRFSLDGSNIVATCRPWVGNDGNERWIHAWLCFVGRRRTDDPWNRTLEHRNVGYVSRWILHASESNHNGDTRHMLPHGCFPPLKKLVSFERDVPSAPTKHRISFSHVSRGITRSWRTLPMLLRPERQGSTSYTSQFACKSIVAIVIIRELGSDTRTSIPSRCRLRRHPNATGLSFREPSFRSMANKQQGSSSE